MRCAVRRMSRQAPHRGIGPGGQGKASPALPTVARAEHFAGLARRCLAAPGEHDTRIVGLHGDAARIGQGHRAFTPIGVHASPRSSLQNTSPFGAHVDARRAGRGERHVVHVEVEEAIDDARSTCRRRRGSGRRRRSRRRPTPFGRPDRRARASRTAFRSSTRSRRRRRAASRWLRHRASGRWRPAASRRRSSVDRPDRRPRTRPSAGRRRRRLGPTTRRRRGSGRRRCHRRPGPARLARHHRQRLDPAVQREGLAMTQPRLARIRAMPHTPAGGAENDVVVHGETPLHEGLVVSKRGP